MQNQCLLEILCLQDLTHIIFFQYLHIWTCMSVLLNFWSSDSLGTIQVLRHHVFDLFRSTHPHLTIKNCCCLTPPIHLFDDVISLNAPLVGLNDAKGIDVAQHIWPWGCPTKAQKQPKNAFSVLFGLFLSFCQTASRPYMLSYSNALRIIQSY